MAAGGLVCGRRLPYIGAMKNPLQKLMGRDVVSVVRLEGVIGGGSRGGGRALSDATLAPLIEAAFTKGDPRAVALVVNSPGGSPAQSSLIAARIRRLAEEKHVPVYAFVEDVAASGGYWLATAADKIYVDPNSIVGSIGVIFASFGFHDFLERNGVERRVHTAGEDKSMLDPFRPEKAEDVERLKRLQVIIHDNFIEQVKSRRGELLQGDDLFSGEIWVGRSAIDVGLADEVGHLAPVMRELFGKKTKFNVLSPRRSLFRRLGLPGVSDAIAHVEDGAFWTRYGLSAP